jgi:hypothetical protein
LVAGGDWGLRIVARHAVDALEQVLRLLVLLEGMIGELVALLQDLTEPGVEDLLLDRGVDREVPDQTLAQASAGLHGAVGGLVELPEQPTEELVIVLEKADGIHGSAATHRLGCEPPFLPRSRG